MKVEYQFFDFVLVKDIGYETYVSAFDQELIEKLNKFGQDGWELIKLYEPYVRFYGATHECKCSYKGLFKRFSIEDAVL